MTSRLERLISQLSQVNAATIADAEVKFRVWLRNASATDGPGAAAELSAQVMERLMALAGQSGEAKWLDAVGVDVRRLHISEYAMGKGGFEFLTPEDRQILAARIQSELEYLRQFAQDLPTLTDAQIEARLQLYVNHGSASYWDGKTALSAEIGLTEERRELNPAEHCFDCVAMSAEGWQPLGSLPSIGDASQCGANCNCTKEYR